MRREACRGSPSRRTFANYFTVVRRGPFQFNFSVGVDSCRVELWIEQGELSDALAQDRESIHRSLGVTLEWVNNPKCRSARIFWVPGGTCGWRSPPDERRAGYEVLADAMYRFHETLIPYIERHI